MIQNVSFLLCSNFDKHLPLFGNLEIILKKKLKKLIINNFSETFISSSATNDKGMTYFPSQHFITKWIK